MSDNNDEILYNESKARELVYFLLRNDINTYKKLIPEIKSLNSEAFEKLFQGIPFKKDANDEYGYDYNVKNKKEFKKLLNKFDNFSVILDAWYNDQKYYEYLKDLWSKYISIENLVCNDDIETEKKIKEILKQNKIDYENWPEKIKDEFLILVKSTEDTRIMELKNEIDNKFSEFNCIIEELVHFKEKVKDIPDIKNYEINAQNMITKMLGTIMLPIAFASQQGVNAINVKQIKSVKKLIWNNDLKKLIWDNSLEEASYIDTINEYVDKFVNKIKGNSGTEFYNLRVQYDEFCDIKSVNAKVKCTDGKIDNLNISQKAKAFLKSKWVCGLHAVLSFLNLGWSVYELTQTYQGFKVLKEYEKKFIEIRTSFNLHKKEIGILPDDFEESRKKIMDVINKIRQDQINLQNLLEDIMKNIKYQEGQQTKAKAQFLSSIALGATGLVGGIYTCNGTAVMYGISTVANIISTVSSGSNYLMSKKIVKGLNELLEKAINLNKEIQDEIDNLINELNSRIKEEPKFDLNESYSSISTNLSIK